MGGREGDSVFLLLDRKEIVDSIRRGSRGIVVQRGEGWGLILRGSLRSIDLEKGGIGRLPLISNMGSLTDRLVVKVDESGVESELFEVKTRKARVPNESFVCAN